MLTAIPRQLTADQRRIVEWGDGPLVVIAGAGTGKTKVIVERVRQPSRWTPGGSSQRMVLRGGRPSQGG